jgi:hypothetical protein
MAEIEKEIAALADLDTQELRDRWRRHYRNEPPPHLSRDLLTRAIAHRIQERAHGGLGKATVRKLRCLAQALETEGDAAFKPGISVKPGARLIREWRGEAHSVIVLEDGFDYNGRRYRSLSKIACEITGAHWSGPRFFGLARAPKPFSGSMEAGNE